MGYYTISISPASQDVPAIVNEFGKLRYNRLPMGMCASGYIFQDKVDELLDDIEGVKTYIDNILASRKDCLKKHIDQLMKIFGRLRATGLKVNALKCSFGLKKIPYIDCVITREDIKTDPKKVHEIMDLGQPATTTEARELIGMVQYYGDMCPRR